jgi:hypothetical protein
MQQTSAGQPTKPEWVPTPDDPLHHVQIGNQHLQVHADDLAEVKKRVGPRLIDHGPTVTDDDPMLARVKAVQAKAQTENQTATTPPLSEKERSTFAGTAFPQLAQDPESRTRYNMMAAMSGQKLATPEDQAEGERGRKAGTIAGGRDILMMSGLGAASAGREALTAGGSVTKQVATGLVDELGNPIMREETVKTIGRIPGLLKSAYDWANANPVKAYLLLKVAGEIGLGSTSLKKIFHLASQSAE